jgi:hypothetical protein
VRAASITSAARMGFRFFRGLDKPLNLGGSRRDDSRRGDGWRAGHASNIGRAPTPLDRLTQRTRKHHVNLVDGRRAFAGVDHSGVEAVKVPCRQLAHPGARQAGQYVEPNCPSIKMERLGRQTLPLDMVEIAIHQQSDGCGRPAEFACRGLGLQVVFEVCHRLRRVALLGAGTGVDNPRHLAWCAGDRVTPYEDAHLPHAGRTLSHRSHGGAA